MMSAPRGGLSPYAKPSNEYGIYVGGATVNYNPVYSRIRICPSALTTESKTMEMWLFIRLLVAAVLFGTALPAESSTRGRDTRQGAMPGEL